MFFAIGIVAFFITACTCSSQDLAQPDPALGAQLVAALEQKDEVRARSLIEQGADTNARQQGTNYTPYVLAAKSCLTETVRLIEKKGFDPDIEVSSGNPVWKSAFLNAAMSGCLDTIRHFVEEKNIDINTRHSFWNETILHKAVQNRNLSLARYALEHGVDTSIADNNGRTAIMLAEEIGAHEIAALIRASASKR